MSAEATFAREVEGVTCRALMRLEHWYQGELSSPWSVLFLQVAPDKWLRFFFDAGVFFWRSVPQPDSIDQDESNTYKLNSIQEAAHLLAQVVTKVGFEGESTSEREVAIEFSGGGQLRLINSADENRVVFV